jgi:hypothetical protein
MSHHSGLYGSTTADVVLEGTLRFKMSHDKKLEDNDFIRSIYRLNHISIHWVEIRTMGIFILRKWTMNLFSLSYKKMTLCTSTEMSVYN